MNALGTRVHHYMEPRGLASALNSLSYIAISVPP
uniref:Uncharacterized protein n=1 Tax=Anguilla anguilla TaxID=7936 RepID=A0A0E9TY98_ANGAN